MKTDYQQMEEAMGDGHVQKTKNPSLNLSSSPSTSNSSYYSISNKRPFPSALMKSRISTSISPKEFIFQFKCIFFYMIISIVSLIFFISYYKFFGLIDLGLALIGFVFLTHGIIKQKLGSYRIGTAFWIFELIAVAVEIALGILVSFKDIFASNDNFFVGLAKFVGVTVVLAILLIIMAFFTYQIMKKKMNFESKKGNFNNFLQRQRNAGANVDSPDNSMETPKPASGSGNTV